MYLCSPGNNYLLANKHIMKSALNLIVRNFSSTAFEMKFSVLYLALFTMILAAAFKIISKKCKSVFDSRYNNALQKTFCVRTK